MMRKGNSKISSLMLEITGRCNHQCLYCYNVWSKCPSYIPKEMSLDEWKNIIDFSKNQLGIESISFTGGEPLLRGDIAELLDYAVSEHSLNVNLITNGTLLNQSTIEDFVSKGLSILEITILTHDPRVHLELTGYNTLRQVISGAQAAEKCGANLVIGTVGTRMNLPSLGRVADIAFALGAKGLMFNRFNPGGRGLSHVDELMPSRAELNEALRLLDSKVKEYKMTITANVPLPPCIFEQKKYKRIKFGYCPSGGEGSYYTISPSGDVRACNHSSAILGKYNDLEQIVSKGNANPPFNGTCLSCAQCPEIKKCNGSCRAASLEMHGDSSVMDPFVTIMNKDN